MPVFNLVMALLFLMGAAVQFNDPDPLRWIVMYICAALACLQYRRVERSWIAPAAVGIVALGWGIAVLRQIEGSVTPADLFAEMQYKGGAVELAREGLGLVLIAAWMTVLVIAERRRRANKEEQSP